MSPLAVWGRAQGALLAGFLAIWLIYFMLSFSLVPQIDAYLVKIIIYAGINVILAVSLNLVNGFTGQFSLGHAGLMSVGAYSSAYFSIQITTAYPQILAHPFAIAIFFPLALFLGGLCASLAGVAVGLPSLRLKGDYLAIVTLGFGEIIRVILINMDAVGGATGYSGIPNLANFGWVWTCALLTVVLTWRLIRSSRGRAFIAIRENEIAAEATGVNTTAGKVQAFVIGAFFAGIAGALYGHELTFLDPKEFDYQKGFEIITMVVLGGSGSITGSVIAAIFLTLMKEILRELQAITQVDLRMVVYALMLIALMLTRPRGIMGAREWDIGIRIPWLRRP